MPWRQHPLCKRPSSPGLANELADNPQLVFEKPHHRLVVIPRDRFIEEIGPVRVGVDCPSFLQMLLTRPCRERAQSATRQPSASHHHGYQTLTLLGQDRGPCHDRERSRDHMVVTNDEITFDAESVDYVMRDA